MKLRANISNRIWIPRFVNVVLYCFKGCYNSDKSLDEHSKPSILATHLVRQTSIRGLWLAPGSRSFTVFVSRLKRFGWTLKNWEITRTWFIMFWITCILQADATQRFKTWESQWTLRPGDTGNIFLQLARNIVALQVEKRCWPYYHPPQALSRNKISLLQVEAACCSKLNWRLLFSTNFFNLQQQILLRDDVWGGR